MTARLDQRQTPFCYESGMQYIADELVKLDLIIRRGLVEFNSRMAVRDDIISDQPMCISHQEIDSLLQETPGVEDAEQQLSLLESQIREQEQLIDEAVAESEAQGIDLPLASLQRVFHLTAFEFQVLIIVLAPELRRKYDRIYAYLQDDITRKRATVDLVLQLLCADETDRWYLHSMFNEDSVMLHAELLHRIEDIYNPSGCSNLGHFLKLDEGILSFVLGRQTLDDRIRDVARLEHVQDRVDFSYINTHIQQQVTQLVDWQFDNQADRHNLVLYFQGPAGVGKEALAMAQCQRLKCNLIYFDARSLHGSHTEIKRTLTLAFRDSILLQAFLYIDGIDQLIGDDPQGYLAAGLITQLVDEYGWLTFLSGEKHWPEQYMFRSSRLRSIEVPMPDFRLRKQAWLQHLKPTGEYAPQDELATRLASQFQLTPRQIRAAADSVQMTNHIEPTPSAAGIDDYVSACRDQSNRRLGDLATKIDSLYHWDDLIVPQRAHELLQQICDQVRQQAKVFNQWGFDTRLSYGKGLSALFTGPPGTGKTMAAQVIANEIRLDLYKVDLSTVISKYIGETEKNLNRIFKEAESSNAILFFDEADALFGKRTEVSDAHDRYANIEVSYLLQKVEEYNGIVILASNFRGNMDDAFTRRIRFIIEFPFPDETSRLQIWKIHFPEQAPVDAEVDYNLLARQFPIPGGNIRNVILNAAFLAAKDDCTINMSHLLESTRQEYEKIGKLWNEGQFAEYINMRAMG
jgi:SpoVK/Ycf46/Vps4 family AAA+-type ATPase